jgi:hypothetical protein
MKKGEFDAIEHTRAASFTSVNAVAAGHVIEAPGGREALTAARCVRALDKGLSVDGW